jgi:transcriptional regulator with XRE-family HTH domain
MPKKSKGDPAMDKVRAIFQESGLSLVELGKRMGYAEETARQAAWQFMQSGDPRMSMVRKFAEAMDISVDELTPRRKRVARKLEIELKDAGCSLDPKRFTELLEERHASMHPDWTVDDLVCHPHQAKAYCDQIRTDAGAPVPDSVILRRLMNARKAH